MSPMALVTAHKVHLGRQRPAGISKGVISYYFKGKDDLIDQIKTYLDGIHAMLKQNRWVYEKALLEIDNLNVIFPYRAKVSEDIS